MESSISANLNVNVINLENIRVKKVEEDACISFMRFTRLVFCDTKIETKYNG